VLAGSDFDAKEGEFKNAEAALARAEQDLAYTELKASFDGIISKRYVEPFEEVQAKQAVSATVTAEFSKLRDAETTVVLPATAVTADAALAPFVWVVDEPAMTARKVPVAVGRLSGGSIEVAEGLSAGERVVVAGVGYLAEGMAVRLLPECEEAQPRADELPVPAQSLADSDPEPEPEPAGAAGAAQ